MQRVRVITFDKNGERIEKTIDISSEHLSGMLDKLGLTNKSVIVETGRTYKYTVIDPSGQRRTGTSDAESGELLLEQLIDQGFSVTEIVHTRIRGVSDRYATPGCIIAFILLLPNIISGLISNTRS